MSIRNIKLLILYSAFLIVTVSCRKDTPPALPQQGNINLSTNKRLLICDEGNFGQNNAAVSIFSPINNAVIISAFAAANLSYTLGDVVQSIGKFNGNYYLVVNNSGTIVVCNSNFVRLTTINGFISPRYIEFVSNDKAYVSNLQLNNTQPNYIQVVNILTNTITKTIHLNGWTEEMQLSYGNVYVCNQSTNYVYIIDTRTDALIDSINVGTTSAHLVKDKNEKLWVSCNSDSTNSIHIPASLVRINPANDSIEAYISLGTIDNAISRLCINGTGDTLYYLMTNVYRMPITATTCPSVPFILQGMHNFYGLCADPNDGTIYVSDAVDYNSNGKLCHYQTNANLLGTYMVGVNPGFMMIDE